MSRLQNHLVQSCVLAWSLKRGQSCVCLSVCLCCVCVRAKLIPLKYTAASGGWGGDLSIRGTVALVEVGTANVIYWGRRKVLRWIFWPAKLFLGFAVDLDRIKHCDTSWVDRGSNCIVESKKEKEKEKKEQSNALTSRFLLQLQTWCYSHQYSYWRLSASCLPAEPLLWWRESRTNELSSG